MRWLVMVVVGAMLFAGCDSGVSPRPSPSSAPSGPPGTALPTTSPPSASPTVAPSAAASPTGEVRWQWIGTLEPDPTGLVGFEDGYVGFGMPRAVVFSVDGLTWETIPLRVPRGTALRAPAAATDGANVVVVGTYTPCTFEAYLKNRFGDCRPRPASWFSADGKTWLSSPSWTGPAGEPGRSGSEFSSVWAVATGWEAAQIFDESDESDALGYSGPQLWHSDDGRTWAARDVQLPVDPEAWSADLFWAVAGADGQRVGCVPAHDRQLFATSIDGVHYEGIDTGSTVYGSWVSGALPPIERGPWLLWGGRSVTADRTEPVIWSTPDLVTWSTTVLPNPSDQGHRHVAGVVPLSGRYVAVGAALQGEPAPAGAVLTWLSDDGRAWLLADVLSRDEPYILDVATGPAGILSLWTRSGGNDDPMGGSEDPISDIWRLQPVP